MLRTTVLVRHVTNLSDARYFAGMGVELLAFPLTGPHALTPDTVRELTGWVAGVRLVGEVDDSLPEAEINRLAEACSLDYVLLSEPNTRLEVSQLKRAVIQTITLNHLEELPMFGEVAYAVLTGLTDTDLDDKHLATRLIEAPVPVLLAVPPTRRAVTAALAWLPTLAGMVLEGGHEVRPGVRDFGDLGEALESLEVED